MMARTKRYRVLDFRVVAEILFNLKASGLLLLVLSVEMSINSLFFDTFSSDSPLDANSEYEFALKSVISSSILSSWRSSSGEFFLLKTSTSELLYKVEEEEEEEETCDDGLII